MLFRALTHQLKNTLTATETMTYKRILVLPAWDEVWSSLAVTTEQGTVLEVATMQAVKDDLDAYLLMVRSGIMATDIRFPWNKVLEATGQSAENPDIRKVMTYCEKSFQEWRANRPVGGASGLVLEPEFAKEAPKQLHSILKSAGNVMRIERLTMAYAIKTERAMDQETLDHVGSQLRAFAQQDEHFHISRGPMGSVYRVKDDKGKDTGVEIAEVGATPAKSGSKIPERFTASVKQLGFASKSQWERARSEGAQTFDQLKAWIQKQ